MGGGVKRKRIFLDCLINCAFGKCTIRDYYLNGFYFLNSRGKRQYISGLEQNRLQDVHNDHNMQAILKDKEQTLNLMGEYISRDWCGQKYHNSRMEYELFEKKHSLAITKPLDSCGGDGIQIIEMLSLNTSLFDYCRDRKLLVEELIIQHESMRQLYPDAVNTIRIVTVHGKVLDAVLRIGQSGMNVDNLSAGGIACGVDISTGIVCTVGRDYKGKEYLKQPDTKITLPGFMIPLWNDCLKLVNETVKKIDGIPVIGWDIAVTENGPTIVEINEGTEIEVFQVPFKKGYRFIWGK